ncbi:MAG TPA: lipopolysaccharide kinase InaA family protein, partial [Gammaproteobacteria bacterium]|nr:lipopolysaccharide kinase InaA family protein [Gammaproteobacteria bacterium]
SLDDVWRDKLDLSEALPLLRGVILELATQHVLGILQRDLHLKNFLVTQRKIYTLDGASITTFGEPLDKKISLTNLGLFFAQLGVGTDDLQEDFFKYYAKLRGWPIKNSDLTTLRSIVIQSNQKRQQRFQKKVLRNCTAFSKTKTSKQWMMQDRGYLSSEFTQFLKNPDKAFSTASHLLKAGRTTSVAKIKINNHLFVVKRYNIKNSLHALRRCLRETRAVTSWRLAQQLRLFCIPTAKPVACIEYRFLGLRSKSYFIMEYIEGPHLGNYFSRYRYGDAEAEKVAERVVNLFKNLGELRMTHGDLKMTNILVANNHPVLIDLDGMIAHRSAASFRRAFKKEINRFMKNWEDQPDVYALFDGLIKKIIATSP